MSQSHDGPVDPGTRQRVPAAPWRRYAACLGADPEEFFKTREHGREARLAINKYCVPCPVRAECLEEGMKERIGVWGGTTPLERRKLRLAEAHHIRLMKRSD